MNIKQKSIEEIKEMFEGSKGCVTEYEQMENHCSMRVGGLARLFVTIDSSDNLIKLLKYVNSNNIQYFVMGRGSNCIFASEIYDGVVINISKDFSSYTVDTESGIIKVDTGMALALLSKIAYENELSGLEFVCGIPGSVGGAVYMNAGAYGSEIKDIFQSAEYIDENGNVNTITNSECNFEYRKSIFKEKKKWILIRVILKLEKFNKEQIKIKMNENNSKRITAQPHDYPSSGSTFKRGTDFITAKVIDEAGLKGYTIGGAQVSYKHAGFIVNADNAKASDVIELISYVKEKVKEKYGLEIEEEVEIVKNKGE